MSTSALGRSFRSTGRPQAQPAAGLALARKRVRLFVQAANCRAVSPLLRDVRKFIDPVWENVEDEQAFFSVLQQKVAAGRCPQDMFATLKDFYVNYKTAIMGSHQVGGNEKLAVKIQATIADAVLDQLARPYTFPSMHRRILEPYNYYELGQRLIATLIDFRNSVLGHPNRWAHIAKLLEAGENVILLANHQTEIDPAVFSHCLETIHPNMATDIVYVAGDRVVTDPLWKPLSMGRNLFCVYSKKHLNDVPELKAQKLATNRKTVIAMQRRLNLGAALLWMAPSGGRDRAKADGALSPDPFDPHSVDLMRDLIQHSKRPGHLIPMAMVSSALMPPPVTVDKEIGERRVMAFSPVGISACEELDINAIIASADDKEAQHVAIAKAAYDAVCEEYARLEEAIKDPAKRGTTYVQPWLEAPAHPLQGNLQLT